MRDRNISFAESRLLNGFFNFYILNIGIIKISILFFFYSVNFFFIDNYINIIINFLVCVSEFK